MEANVNIGLLKEKVAEKGIKVDELAEMIGIDRTTMYRKLAAGGVKFTVEEMQKIVTALCLTNEDAINIFFTQKVA